MKKSIRTAVVGLLMVPAMALGAMAFVPTAYAACGTYEVIVGTGCRAMTPAERAQYDLNIINPDKTCLFTNGLPITDVKACPSGIFTTITNTALFIIGALSVLMLIYGGIRYTISMGDSKNVEAAKNTITYAIIGIIVALLAGAIVNFVLGSFITA